ncbi:TPA: ABC transporter permease [Streptococcus equi subsp. zooepidemicus]|uniref:D-methionine transport system permease protein MetI n=3 Tax=Streptococcus equi subsp. zooepidemicus TaxID=40041 RepID=B4U4T8_STREM|nr:methionine ABC transporter permease [Streptococcus equi]KIS16503.1 D-methionine transport system permease [Streptococcus equi subsp. zooepidemicus Sz4is]ACG63005.1 D-methionine transport system permease protein MetI [Streptococcus equi subsp. zooepidemicus MGCS10565]EQB23122.1 D-methionine transport system permease [Streptococcus equi subsp. zooepidemicus SzS31A1]KIS04719.1 D-methionine transport system permease [Streptococcus equi subsp. zooepidemicus Sz12is]MCD3385473.1 ABC transporter pe
MLELFQAYLPNVYELGWSGDAGWGVAIWNTLYMTIVPFIVGGATGLFIGLLLVLMGPDGVIENRMVCWLLDKLTSIFRAIPFVILIAILASFTYLIMGTTLGATAALVPLTFATFPFFARQVQVVFSELDRGVIEAAQASGATFWDIVRVYLSEGLPDLIRVSTVTLISLVGETAMAGAIGAGGLGNVAISYGYNRFNNDVTWVATLIILLLIFAIQFIGDSLTRHFSHK